MADMVSAHSSTKRDDLSIRVDFGTSSPRRLLSCRPPSRTMTKMTTAMQTPKWKSLKMLRARPKMQRCMMKKRSKRRLCVSFRRTRLRWICPREPRSSASRPSGRDSCEAKVSLLRLFRLSHQCSDTGLHRIHLAGFSTGCSRRMVASRYYVHHGRWIEVVLHHARRRLAACRDGRC